MKKRMTKKQRTDIKEEVLNYIISNSNDGCTQKDITDRFELSQTLARSFLAELQIEKRVKAVNFHRFTIYKVVGK